MEDGQKTALFLFAHQDDEVGIFQKLIDEQYTGCQIQCVYLTDHPEKGLATKIRNQESINVLRKLGIDQDSIHFAGELLSITDGSLLEHLDQAGIWLEQFIRSCLPIKAIYVPAWEGGHPDHDAVHALGVVIANKLGMSNFTYQYSLYNGYQCSGPLFRTFVPIPANGPLKTSKISWLNRLRFVRYCLSYPSQIITWIGLFPFALLHYVVWGKQYLQITSMSRLLERPHSGRLYYERRKFCTYERLNEKLSGWVARQSSTGL